jgi:hypothetical protein
MRPANAGCRPLFVANDYASGLTAPTSGTNTTFDGLLHARVKMAGSLLRTAGWTAITIAFSAGQKAARNPDLLS